MFAPDNNSNTEPSNSNQSCDTSVNTKTQQEGISDKRIAQLIGSGLGVLTGLFITVFYYFSEDKAHANRMKAQRDSLVTLREDANSLATTTAALIKEEQNISETVASKKIEVVQKKSEKDKNCQLNFEQQVNLEDFRRQKQQLAFEFERYKQSNSNFPAPVSTNQTSAAPRPKNKKSDI